MVSSFLGPVRKVVRRGPIITSEMLPGNDGNNINGPSLIKVPSFIANPLATYYLYFAHHVGSYIRLAYADDVGGPYTVYQPGTLSLTDAAGIVSHHIASPDVLVDEANERLVMYFHGPAVELGSGSQRSFVATSTDGVKWRPLSGIIGDSYARVWKHDDGKYYGLFGSIGQITKRSDDGFNGWTEGPAVLPPTAALNSRHVALKRLGQKMLVFYTRRGDAPERIFVGDMDLRLDWGEWAVRESFSILRPEEDYEGVNEPVMVSRFGPANNPEHALRDPAIYEEDGRTWLIYSGAGESNLCLAELTF